MSKLPNGHYHTAKGSTLEISGEHGGRFSVDWDWCEEGACCDCSVNPHPVEWDEGEWRLTWDCDHCHGGSAVLILGRVMVEDDL